MTKTFGRMQARVGERCSNFDERWTCPGCYYDHSEKVEQCVNCGAPLECTEERITQYVCTIADKEDEDE